MRPRCCTRSTIALHDQNQTERLSIMRSQQIFLSKKTTGKLTLAGENRGKQVIRVAPDQA